MASKQKNPNIGMIACQFCGKPAAVRRNRAGKLYYDCLEDGRIAPNLPAGQKRILDTAVIWGEQGTPPDSCPDWIAQNWPWHRAMKEGQGPAPAQAPAPPNGGAPVITGEAPTAPPPPPAPVKWSRPRMPPPPPAPVKQEKPAAKPAAAPRTGFGFLEGW